MSTLRSKKVANKHIQIANLLRDYRSGTITKEDMVLYINDVYYVVDLHRIFEELTGVPVLYTKILRRRKKNGDKPVKRKCFVITLRPKRSESILMILDAL